MITLEQMLMCGKVTHKNLTDSHSLFRTKKHYGNIHNRLFRYGKPYLQNMDEQRQLSHILQIALQLIKQPVIHVPTMPTITKTTCFFTFLLPNNL